MSINSPTVAYDPRFPDTDDVPVESEWHRDEMNLLIDVAWNHHHGRDDYFCGGNMGIYYDPLDPRKVVAPDFFFVWGVPSRSRRRTWLAWQEGRFPNVIIELLSPRTKHKDRKTNKDIYETTFRTPEYFLYDPATQVLDGWRLDNGQYARIAPNENGWLWSEELGLWLGFWDGSIGRGAPELWIRFYDRDGKLVPTQTESERHRAEQEHRRAEQEHRRAERARRQVEQERTRAEVEHQRAEQERKQREAAEAELARLRALLDQRKDGG